MVWISLQCVCVCVFCANVCTAIITIMSSMQNTLMAVNEFPGDDVVDHSVAPTFKESFLETKWNRKSSFQLYIKSL